MRLGRDGIAGLIGLAVSLVLLPQAFGLPKLPIVPVGPGFYPAIVLVFMAAGERGAGAPGLCGSAPRCRLQTSRRPRSRSAPTGWCWPRSSSWRSTSRCCRCSAFASRRSLFVAGFQLVLERPTTLRQWAMLAGDRDRHGGDHLPACSSDTLSVLLPRGRWTGW